MTAEANNSEALRRQMEAYIEERQIWLHEAVELVTGDRETPIEDVFQYPMTDPQDARAAATPLDLDAEQEKAFREIVGRFGIGGAVDVVSGAEYQVMEGGKPWKVEAEAAIAGNAGTLIFAGQTFRKIGTDESDYLARKFGVDLAGVSEYDMVRFVAQSQLGFVALQEAEVLPFGYEVSPEHTFIYRPTEQLLKIGDVKADEETAAVPVWLLRVDGETYVDEQDGKRKQRHRPDTAALMAFIAEVLSAQGDETARVAVNTSTTYAARVIDTLRVGLRFARVFDVGMYGRQTLADIKGETVATASEIQNFPGELRLAHDKLQHLADAIQTTQPNE